MSRTVQDIKNTLRILNESTAKLECGQLAESQLTNSSFTVSINEHTQLDEASELINLFSGGEGAMKGTDKLSLALAKFIHSTHKLSANAVPEPYTLPRLYLKEFKQNPDNFLIFKGSKGWAAMKPNYEGSFEEQPSQTAIKYVAYLALEENVSTDDEGSASLKITVKELEQKRGGKYTSPDPRNANVMDELREYIGGGRLQAWFIPGAGFQGWGADQEQDKPVSIDREKLDTRAARTLEADPDAVLPNFISVLETIRRAATTQLIAKLKAEGATLDDALKQADKTSRQRIQELTAVLKNVGPGYQQRIESLIPQLSDWVRSELGFTKPSVKFTPENFAAVIQRKSKDYALQELIGNWIAGE